MAETQSRASAEKASGMFLFTITVDPNIKSSLFQITIPDLDCFNLSLNPAPKLTLTNEVEGRDRQDWESMLTLVIIILSLPTFITNTNVNLFVI